MDSFWHTSSKPAPLDDEQFVVSFAYADVAAWKPFLDQYGFVVLDGVLSQEECAASLDEFWAEAPRVARDDWRTWEDANWPSRSKFLTEAAAGQRAFDTRTSPVLYEVFRQVYGGEHRLLCNVDNYGVMRGTRFEEEGEERPAWRVSLEPHWDRDPWHYTAELARGAPRQYQGLVALTECYNDWRGSTGGFRVCPGSAAALEEWCRRVKRPADLQKDSFHIASSDPWYKRLQKVPLRRGSLCIWDSGALHANFENSSRDVRIVQYVRMMPAPEVCSLPSRARLFPMSQTFDVSRIRLTPLGRKLLGIDKWE